MNDSVLRGQPDIGPEIFRGYLAEKRSPALREADTMYRALVEAEVLPSAFLAFFKHESQCGNEGIVKEFDTKNPGNVRTPERRDSGATIVQTPRGPFARFPTWTAGTRDWAWRLRGPKYEGAGLRTVRAVIPKYAPSSDNNDPDGYANDVLLTMALLDKRERQQGGTMEKPGVNTQYRSPNKGYAGQPRKVEAICWHVTVGGAAGSLGWLCNPDSNASSNYLIGRDGTIYELVPPTESAWANGAVNRPDMGNPLIASWINAGVNPNTRTVSIENERLQSANNQPGGFTDAQRDSLIRLTAWLCATFGVACNRRNVIRHAQIDSVNRQFCPGVSEGEMVDWIGRAAAQIDGGGSVPAEDPGDRERRLLLDWVVERVPHEARGDLVQEGEVDFDDAPNQRLAIYEKQRFHRYRGASEAFLLDGPTSFEARRDAGAVRIY